MPFKLLKRVIKSWFQICLSNGYQLTGAATYTSVTYEINVDESRASTIPPLSPTILTQDVEKETPRFLETPTVPVDTALVKSVASPPPWVWSSTTTAPGAPTSTAKPTTPTVTLTTPTSPPPPMGPPVSTPTPAPAVDEAVAVVFTGASVEQGLDDEQFAKIVETLQAGANLDANSTKSVDAVYEIESALQISTATDLDTETGKRTVAKAIYESNPANIKNVDAVKIIGVAAVAAAQGREPTSTTTDRLTPSSFYLFIIRSTRRGA